jgi:DNA polymerase III gamma/tau subunit
MQVSKISLALCVLALGVAPAIHAADTPAQAAARAALASKLFEIGAETPATNKPSAAQVKTAVVIPAAAPAAKTVVAPVVVPAAKPVVKNTEPVMVPLDKKAKAKAEQAAADAKAAELKAQKDAAKLAAAQKEKDAAAAAAQAKAKAKAEKLAAESKAKADLAKKAAEVAAAKQQVKSNLSQTKVESPKVEQPKTSTKAKTLDTPEQAKAREALAHSMFQDAANTAPATAAKPAVTSAPVAKPVAPAVVNVAPPLPINSVQQHKLAELLTKYKADMVTPDEYQKLRAAILANP